jgi:hypothetical protein
MLAATLFCSIVLPVTPAHAGMIPTQDVVTHQAALGDRERIQVTLERAEVVAMLDKHGVSLDEAKARVAALSDTEARMMAERIDQMPAGGNNVLGILFSIFIILLVTDLLGLTNVFPFTNR